MLLLKYRERDNNHNNVFEKAWGKFNCWAMSLTFIKPIKLVEVRISDKQKINKWPVVWLKNDNQSLPLPPLE